MRYLILLFICLPCYGQQIDLVKIAEIESSNNPLAYNRKSQATGLYQITPICLKDYNIMNRDDLELTDMLDSVKCRKVASWYFEKRIPQLLKYFHKDITTENILWAYNAGIKRVVDGYMPEETKNYIQKYGGEK